MFSEINVLQKTVHINLMEVFEIIEDNENFYFICELTCGGDLKTLIKRKKNKLNEK